MALMFFWSRKYYSAPLFFLFQYKTKKNISQFEMFSSSLARNETFIQRLDLRSFITHNMVFSDLSHISHVGVSDTNHLLMARNLKRGQNPLHSWLNIECLKHLVICVCLVLYIWTVCIRSIATGRIDATAVTNREYKIWLRITQNLPFKCTLCLLMTKCNIFPCRIV